MGEREQSKVQRSVLLSKEYPFLHSKQLLGPPQVRQLVSHTAWHFPAYRKYPDPQARQL